jgi:hypothetical protein
MWMRLHMAEMWVAECLRCHATVPQPAHVPPGERAEAFRVLQKFLADHESCCVELGEGPCVTLSFLGRTETRKARSAEVLIFPEHCANHRTKARRYWIEPAGQGYKLPLVVTVEYRCKCLDSQMAETEPLEVRDFAHHTIPRTNPPNRT